MEKQLEKANLVAQTACESMLFEVVLTPKPGLVDANNMGSHSDMDVFTFISSALSFSEELKEFYLLGINKFEKLRYSEIFSRARVIGIRAEEKMLSKTNDVNTHKGSIFILGLLTVAKGISDAKVAKSNHKNNSLELLEIAKSIVSKTLTKEIAQVKFKEASERTNGDKILLNDGIDGIRGEALRGFPSIKKLGLPYLEKKVTINTFKEKQVYLLRLLLLLMSEVDDSNVIHRSDIHQLELVKKEAKRIFDLSNDDEFLNEVEVFDEVLISKNISSGGAADLLIATIFLAKLDGIINF